MQNKIEKTFKNRYLYLAMCCVACSLLSVFTAWQESFKSPNQFLLVIGIFLVAVVYIKTFKLKFNLDERDIIFIILALGFVFRVVYICETGYMQRQHDVGGTEGHLDYIKRLYSGKGIPDEDFSNKFSQFYQPPFWHTICAIWLKIQTWIGFTFNQALENLQLISLFCSSAIMFISHRLFRLFNLKNTPFIIACCIVAFHPTFIIFSGSINNDVMSLMFALLSLVNAIKWYRNPTFKNILFLALSIGISMAVKLSGGLISVGVAVLFAIKLFGKEYKNKRTLIAQFASFGAVCVPLALWWQIRNLIKFDIPLTYVTALKETNRQYIGFRDVFERFFDFSSLWNDGVHPVRIAKGLSYDYFEYNIPLGALKTSVFGEYYIGKGNIFGEIFAKLLFFSAAILAVISVFASVWVLVNAIKQHKDEQIKKAESRVKRPKKSNTKIQSETKISLSEIIFPLICSATLFVSYVKFCFDYAFFCTMDFRYIALTVIIGALYIGLLLKETNKNNKMFGSILNYICCSMTVIMSIASFVLYGTIA